MSKHTTLLGAASQPPPRAPGARYNAGGSLSLYRTRWKSVVRLLFIGGITSNGLAD